MRNTFVLPSKREFDGLFLQGYVRGGGLGDIRVFTPPPITQRGKRGGGIFTLLSGLAKRAVPFIMRTIAPEAIQMGKALVGDLMEGRRVRESLKSRGKQALKGVGRRMVGGGSRKKIRKVTKRKKKKNRQPSQSKRCYKTNIFDGIA